MLTNIYMNEQIADIRPALRALKESSWATLTQGKYHYNGTTHSVLLLPESDCTETPSALLEDTVLKPVDKMIWLLLMMIVRQSSGDAYLPTLAELGKMANARAPDTVWRALSILRCTRWLTACQKMCYKGGLFKPSAYVLSARPLPISDALFLDTEYRVFLEKSVGHSHARVRKVACEALSQLPEETVSGTSDHSTLAGPVI